MNSHSKIMSGVSQQPGDRTNGNIHSLDDKTFNAYMNALGFDSEIPPPRTMQTIETLLYQHATKFAFTTFPANFADEVKLTATELTQYMLKNKQGFCFHHNVSIGAALKQLGFDIRLVAASIRKSQQSNEVFPLATHVVVILNLDNESYLIDPGWSDGIIKGLPFSQNYNHSHGKYHTVKLTNDTYGLAQKTDEGVEIKYEFTRTPVSLDSCKEALNNVMSKDHLFYGLFFYSIVTDKNEICAIVNHSFTRSTLDGETLESIEYDNLSAVDILKKHLSPEQKVLSQISKERFINQELANSVMYPKKTGSLITELCVVNNKNSRVVL